jgi:hypothetical protein
VKEKTTKKGDNKMLTRQERIDEHISTINNYGSEVSDVYSELRYCDPDYSRSEKASNFGYEHIKFQDLDSVKKAREEISGFQDELNDLKGDYEQASEIVGDGADKLEEILDALWEIQEILEKEIKVGQVVTAHYNDRFTVLAVAAGKDENFAWVRNTNNDYDMPSSFRWSELTVVK